MLWSSRLVQFIKAHYYVGRWLLLFTLIVVFALAYAIRHLREGFNDGICVENAYVLSLALSEYTASYGCLPPPFISDQFGKPLYSWRVLILPLVDAVPMSEEFDYTKPWDDPVNMQIGNELMLKYRFCCPSINHAKSRQTDYFYVLNAEDRWPRDFFHNPRPKIILVESKWRAVHWSEPVDFVYETPKTVFEPYGLAFLNKLRETKPPHPSGYNCVISDYVSDYVPFKIPYGTPHPSDNLIRSLVRPPVKEKDGAEKERIDQLVAKLMKALGDPRKDVPRTALLFLSELGPQAAAAVPMLRQIRDDGDKRLQPIAAMALARIEN